MLKRFALLMVLPGLLVASLAFTPGGNASPVSVGYAKDTPSPAPLPTANRTVTLVPTPTWAFPPLPLAWSAYDLAALGPKKFQIRGWTEAEFQAALDQIQVKTSWANGSMPAADQASLYTPDDFNAVYALMLQEALKRFKTSPQFESFERQFVARSLVAGGPVEPLRAYLEEALNHGTVTPQGLPAWLQNIHADLATDGATTVPSMFLQGIDGTLIPIKYNHDLLAAFALRQYGSGLYKVYALLDRWQYAYAPKLSIDDLNANRKSEILIEDRYNGAGPGDFCTQDLKVIEWNGHNFTNLAPGMKHYSFEVSDEAGKCKGFQFVADETSGAQSIIATYHSNYTTLQSRYQWNGKSYAWVKDTVTIDPMPTASAEIMLWTLSAGWKNDASFAILERAVPFWTPQMTDALGPGAQDYFRFRLGIGYALRGQKNQAEETLAKLSQQPAREPFDEFSKWAGAFLAQYQGDGSLFQACAAANRQFEADRQPFRLAKSIDDFDGPALIKAWGFSLPAWKREGGFIQFSAGLSETDAGICPLDDAFHVLLNDARIRPPWGIADWLAKNGVPYNGLTRGDIDGDWVAPTPEPVAKAPWGAPTPTLQPVYTDENDWLVVLPTGYLGRPQLWAILRSGEQLNGAVVKDLDGVVGTIHTLWHAFRPAYKQGLYNAYLAGDRLAIFKIVQNGGQMGILFPVDERAPLSGVSWMNVVPGSLYDRLEVSYFDNTLRASGWADDSQQVTLAGESVDVQIEQIEARLFDPKHPDYGSAAHMADDLLKQPFYDEMQPNDAAGKQPAPRIRPQVLYLKALAYDMAGWRDQAVETYWELCYRYPNNPYAWLASQKIVKK